jgi:hypothetical protein
MSSTTMLIDSQQVALRVKLPGSANIHSSMYRFHRPFLFSSFPSLTHRKSDAEENLSS